MWEKRRQNLCSIVYICMMQTTFIPAILLQKPFCEIDSFSKLAIMMIFKIFKQEYKLAIYGQY